MIANRGIRFLLGLAPTFSLADLRFADIINQSLESRPEAGLQVDVFDVDDLEQGRSIPAYFPRLDAILSTPVVGVWENGQFQRVLTGGPAMNLVFQVLQIDQTAETVVRSVRPPTADILDD